MISHPKVSQAPCRTGCNHSQTRCLICQRLARGVLEAVNERKKKFGTQKVSSPLFRIGMFTRTGNPNQDSPVLPTKGKRSVAWGLTHARLTNGDHPPRMQCTASRNDTNIELNTLLIESSGERSHRGSVTACKQ